MPPHYHPPRVSCHGHAWAWMGKTLCLPETGQTGTATNGKCSMPANPQRRSVLHRAMHKPMLRMVVWTPSMLLGDNQHGKA